MSTSVDYVEYVVDQIKYPSDIRYRSMFGEYMVYINDKPLIILGDNTAFVKMVPELDGLIEIKGYPYPGAKEHYILDFENSKLTTKVIEILDKVIPLPKSKKK